MSTIVETQTEHEHHGPAKGLKRWLFTTNHKDIGTLYLWFSFLMLFIGGSMAMVIRAELFQPGLQIVEPEFFNQITAAISSNSLPQTFSVTYTVNNNGCEASSTVDLTVLPDPDAGEDNSDTLCENDVDDQGIFNSTASARAFYLDFLGAEDTDGTFKDFVFKEDGLIDFYYLVSMKTLEKFRLKIY